MDLQPYFCSFDNCPDHDRLYSSRRAWFNHELKLHRRAWTCVDDCSMTFPAAADFKCHLEHIHKDVCSAFNLDRVVASREHQIHPRTSWTCPFCAQLLKSSDSIRRHIGRHMSHIALWSLPNSNEDEAEDEDEGSDPLSAHSSVDETEDKVEDNFQEQADVGHEDETEDKVEDDLQEQTDVGHRHKYTIGCICPMGVELAAMEGMLDEIHESLPSSRDQNNYTLGRMGSHNVVVAVSEIGTSGAAVVATELLNDFPSIRFSLLVGIGGGIPGEDEDDIRLGDVVVSKPTETFGGVVQYDMGKVTDGKRFQRTGSLNRPPAVLSASVHRLKAQQERLGSQIPRLLSEMIQKYPKMEAQYKYQGMHNDRLFLAIYPHQTGSTCKNCDSTKVVDRDDRPDTDPQIHYGTIGSVNQVVKDAATRDQLREDLGVLCVEMEAAGLMDDFPCLVIRGICDYADSHKNDRWQPYAAATAAAYAKELLSIIPAQKVVAASKAKEG
jgi:nucleoside phosphorylase